MTYRPEVVNQNIEDAQYHNQYNRTPFRLETYHHHHASHKSKYADYYPPNPPMAREHKPHKQEYQQHPPRQLKVHLAVLVIHRRESGRSELPPHPRIREYHQKAAHNAEVAEEEVEVEYETVAKSLGNDDANESDDGPVAVLADYYHGRADYHGEDVDEEKEVGKASRY